VRIRVCDKCDELPELDSPASEWIQVRDKRDQLGDFSHLSTERMRVPSFDLRKKRDSKRLGRISWIRDFGIVGIMMMSFVGFFWRNTSGNSVIGT